jgi:hypothetical protein
VFAEAPTILRPVDLPQNLASLGAAEVVVESAGDSDNPELIARGWWLRYEPESMNTCIEALHDLVKDQKFPYDVSELPCSRFRVSDNHTGCARIQVSGQC